MPEVFDVYDDYHLDHLFALWALENIGDDNRRTARICSVVHQTGLNISARDGKPVESDQYHGEEYFMPKFGKQKKRVRGQSWSQIKQGLGI